MALFHVTFREIQRRPGRAILTVLSIVIGVAAVVSVSLAITESRRSYKQMYEALTGRAALEVVADGGGFFPLSEAGRIAKIPGVEAAVPSLQHFTILYNEKRRLNLLALGIDARQDTKVRDYALETGRFFREADEVLLESGFARAIKVQPGGTVRILTRRGVQEVKVVGLVTPRGISGVSQAGALFLPLSSAQWYFRRSGLVNNISIVLDDGFALTAATEAITKKLPEGLKVREPAERGRLGRDAFLNAEQGLSFGGALITTLAIFIILNTFLMNVGERKRLLAILRAVGATPRQIQRMLLGEALLMGLVGTAVGIPIGLWGAKFLLGAMASLRGTAPPPLEGILEPILWAAAIGPGIALLGAYFPSLMARAVTPLEGIRVFTPFSDRRTARRLALIGLILYLVSGILLWACIRGWLPIGVSVPVGIVFLASFALIIPLLLRPVGIGISAVTSPWLGVEIELAEKQLSRRSTRAGLAAGVLFIAVSTAVGLGTTILNNVADVRGWTRKTLVGDFFVRAMFPDQATGVALPMPDSYADEIRKINGVTSVEAVRFLEAELKDLHVILVVREFDDPTFLPLDLTEGEPDEVRRGLFNGEAVIGSVLANRLGIRQGDSIKLHTAQGVCGVRVAGISMEYTASGLAVYVERKAAQQIIPIEGADVFVIRAEASALTSVSQQLGEFSDKQGLLLHSFGELSAIIDGIMTGVLQGLWAILGLGFVVAGFGIANTLTMNVLEQTREIGLLRSIAMSRRQVRKLIITQAFMIALLGLIVGTIGGMITAYIIGLCMLPLIHYTVPFVLHPLLLLGIIPATLFVVFLASWIPMQRAAAVNLLEALSYE